MIVKKISLMMLASVFVTIAMVVTVTAWTAVQNNQTAAENSSRMVAGGVRARVERLASMNYDYSAWSAAFEAARARDIEWLGENMGIGANGNEFHALQFVFPDDWSSLTWTAESLENSHEPIVEPVIPIDIVRQWMPTLKTYERDVPDTQTAFLEIDGALNLIAVSRVQPWGEQTDIPMEDFPLNVFALRLDERFLSEIAETYLLDEVNLSLVTGAMENSAELPLLGPEGRPVGYLHWMPPRPGDKLFKTASLPLAAGLLFFLILTGLVTLLARQNAQQLVNSEAEAVLVARIDAMTGLPNRLALNERFKALRQAGETVCILMIDLNGFKLINDKYGHNVGDEFIRQFAEFVRDCLTGNVFAARLGGDEFTIVFPGQDAEEQCIAFCKALEAKTKDAIHVRDYSLALKFALGYSVGDILITRTSELLRQSDVAMYHAKQSNSFTPIKFDPSLEQGKIDEENLIAALRNALETCEEFEVVYQPIVDIKTGKMTLAEALLRWHSPSLGSVPPAYFIPIAERTALIVNLGNFVIEQVFSDMSRLKTLNASINLSPVQLRNRKIINFILERVNFFGVDPSRVTFEITETTFIEDEELASFIMAGLRDSGFQIALDDFGTGFSSIGYLRKMHFDKLKVDKSFVDDIGVTETGENLLTSLGFLSRALGLEIVAEGVETEEQLGLLTDLSFDMVQGFFLSKPISVAELSELIDAAVDWSGSFDGFHALEKIPA